ncbi:MAG: type II secretion system protein GspG [Planctomycetota bacterium]|jgi:hypothetical protein
MTTEQRLERLERENRWMRRIGAVGVSVVVCSLLACEKDRRYEPVWLAEVRCKTLHDKAMIWKVNRKPPDSLGEMVAPLREGDDEDFLDSVPDDPWGHPYVLKREGTKIRVYSWGEDGQEGTDDDIVYPFK